MIEASHLTKRFRKFTAVNDVSFNVENGSTVLLIGPNGAGKTTIIRCIMGLISFNGTILVDGLDVHKRGEAIRGRIGYVPQQLIFPESKVMEHSKFVCALKRVKTEVIPDKLKLMGLWDYKDVKIQSLSAGLRQRFSIALALMNEPSILIFDEPISNVDIRGQMDFESIVNSLSGQGKTILIATHFSGLSEFADNAVVLNHGNVIATGSPEELLGKINAKNNLYVKIHNGLTDKAKDVIAKYEGDEITVEGEWIAAKVPASTKIALVNTLLQSGFDVQDLIIEDITIESEYLKLIGLEKAS
jgi:ABC-type multidrug transport system ATPase subunit